MMHEKLESINTKLDALALQKRLEIEAEHLKRIKCTKVIRLFGTFTGSIFKINTRVLNEITNHETTPFWDVVKRVAICVNTNYPCVGDEIFEQQGNGIHENTNQETLENGINMNQETRVNGIQETRESTFTGNLDTNPNYSHADINKFSNEDQILHPEIFEWTKDSETDGFFIPINADYKKIQVLIKLENKRNVFKLNHRLAKLLNKYSGTKHGVIKDLYKYINAKKLNNYVSSNVECDEPLKELFNLEFFNFNNVAVLLEPFFEPLPYCCIDVDFKSKIGSEGKTETNGRNPVNFLANTCQIWDIEIETDDLSQMPTLYPAIVHSFEKRIKDIQVSKKKALDKIELLNEFTENPSLFINRKVALDSEGMGTKTIFYDNLNVQSGLFELIKRKD